MISDDSIRTPGCNVLRSDAIRLLVNSKTLEVLGLEYFKMVANDNKPNMAWIKSHTRLISEPNMRKLTPAEWGIWFQLTLITGQIGNLVPLDPGFLRSVLPLDNYKHALPLAKFEELGLIEVFEKTATGGLERKKERKSERQNEEGSLKGAPSGPTAPTKKEEADKARHILAGFVKSGAIAI